MGAFFGKNPPSGPAEALPGYVNAIKEKNSNLTKFGVLGVSYFCPPPVSIGKILKNEPANFIKHSTAGVARLLR